MINSPSDGGYDGSGDVDQALPLTGERTVPGIPHENYWFRRHEAAYRFIAPLTHDATVIEIGCGEGYGTAALAHHARTIVGIDYDAATIAHATRTYPQAAFIRANLSALPIRTNAADVIGSLQVIEHVWNHPEFLAECRRALNPTGQLIISTPNRLTFSPGAETPTNPFHTKEFSANELIDLLQSNSFTTTELYGLHAGDRLHQLDSDHDGFVAAQLATAPEQWTNELRRDVAAVRVEDFVILPAAGRDVDQSLDLLVVARRA